MRLYKRWIIGGIAFIISAGIAQTAYAGSVNANEQSVISAVSGQFEKDGIIYAVKPEYINSVTNYLAQDDVELSAEQAQAAISEIYANVQTGVESGYLVEVGRTTAPEAEPSQPPSEGKAGQQESITPTKKAEKQKSEESQKEPETAGIQESEGSKAESEGESGTLQQENKKEPETEKSSSVISILELVDKAPPQTYEYLNKDTDARMQQLKVRYGIMWGCVAAAAFAIALVLVVSLHKKLLISHSHRKLRRILKYILTAAIAALSLILCLIGGAWFGAFQKNAILSKLADTGYYTFVHNELKKDTSISFSLLNIPNSVMDQSLTYEKVVIAARQQVENDLNKGIYKADTSILIEPLKADIEEYLKGQSVTMTKEAEAGLVLLMDRLDEKYTALLKWPFVSWWSQLKVDYTKTAVLILPISLLLMAAAQGILVFLHHYKYRGFSLGAKGLMLGSILGFLVFTGSNMVISARWGEVNPPYMNSFFEIYKSGIWRAGAVTCGIGVLLAWMVLAAVRAWKEGR
ncbi:hypothetical protein [Lacrimispora sphenoides]|uniref:Uncharacterized protein n=1 Tax=Lacrimispora sphenoides JCM 1415 TaxID=1297793 RepID=A0ABY1CHV4_9FIRM|nr:hypothetical protein [Lacrimispora sphenoides]SEU05682.1 hypothetical protein SAMN02745906_4463 [[Clostridium] sphenoides JCM 1415]SUY49033.1 Uncharacterised protein [Lacrimispora sphenoides]